MIVITSSGSLSGSPNTRYSNGWFEVLSIGATVRTIGLPRAMRKKHVSRGMSPPFCGSGDGIVNDRNALAAALGLPYLSNKIPPFGGPLYRGGSATPFFFSKV